MPLLTQRERMAFNLIEKHGEDGLALLLDMLKAGVKQREIARAFGVSHARVDQWSSVLGVKVRLYKVHANVEALALEPVLARV